MKLSRQQTYAQMYHLIIPEMMHLQEELQNSFSLSEHFAACVALKKKKIFDERYFIKNTASEMMRDKKLNTALRLNITRSMHG